jgi:hypothetical protein
MLLEFTHICENCCKQFVKTLNFKNCGYCGSTLINKSVDVPISVWKIIIGYIPNSYRCINRTILSLSLTNSELFNATYCVDSTILIQMYNNYGKGYCYTISKSDLEYLYDKYKSLYDICYDGSFYDFFTLFRKYFDSCKEDNRDIIPYFRFTNKNIKLIENTSNFNEIESLFDKINRATKCEIERTNDSKLYIYKYESSILSLFYYYIFISLFCKIDHNEILNNIRQKQIFYRIPTFDICKNCSGREYSVNKHILTPLTIDYCTKCTEKRNDVCHICKKELKIYEKSEIYKSIFGDIYLCGYNDERNIFTKSQRKCLERAINEILKSQ